MRSQDSPECTLYKIVWVIMPPFRTAQLDFNDKNAAPERRSRSCKVRVSITKVTGRIWMKEMEPPTAAESRPQANNVVPGNTKSGAMGVAKIACTASLMVAKETSALVGHPLEDILQCAQKNACTEVYSVIDIKLEQVFYDPLHTDGIGDTFDRHICTNAHTGDYGDMVLGMLHFISTFLPLTMASL